MSDKAEQIWNALLHYLKPLTDEPESAQVIIDDDLRALQKDLLGIYEGKEIVHEPARQLPEKKPKKLKEAIKDIEKEVADIGVPEPKVQTATMAAQDVEVKKKPWWKPW